MQLAQLPHVPAPTARATLSTMPLPFPPWCMETSNCQPEKPTLKLLEKSNTFPFVGGGGEEGKDEEDLTALMTRTCNPSTEEAEAR